MSRIILFLWAFVLGGAALAQGSDLSGFSGLARLDADASSVTDRRGGFAVDLQLSQGVPYRVFILDDPAVHPAMLHNRLYQSVANCTHPDFILPKILN